MLTFAVSALVLGLSAGISPGPMFALVLSETLNSGPAAGVRVALAPLFSDAPIILAGYFLLSKIKDHQLFLGIFAIIGALYLMFLGYKGLTTKNFNTRKTLFQNPLLKGILINFLNPHPYLFWMTIGASFILQTLQHSRAALFVFLFCFYFCLVGAKIVLALVTGVGRKMLPRNTLLLLNRVMGVILTVFGFMLGREGVNHF